MNPQTGMVSYAAQNKIVERLLVGGVQSRSGERLNSGSEKRGLPPPRRGTRFMERHEAPPRKRRVSDMARYTSDVL